VIKLIKHCGSRASLVSNSTEEEGALIILTARLDFFSFMKLDYWK